VSASRCSAQAAPESTLLNLIAGFLPPASGSLLINGQPHTHAAGARPVSMLFQENNLFNHLTMRQNIALGMHPAAERGQRPAAGDCRTDGD
jgi:ABC-type thiamine transport system ATPase subunit